jgi:transposase
MGFITVDDKDRIPDFMWEEMKQIIPQPKDNHPLGCHRKRIDDRRVMDGIFFVLRTGCQWQALDQTNLCKHSVAHDRFQEWAKAGVFFQLWERGLMFYDATKGLKLKWQSIDGSMTKSPLGGEATGKNPTDRAKKGPKEASFQKVMACPLDFLSQVPTDMIANLPEKLWKPFQNGLEKKGKG